MLMRLNVSKLLAIEGFSSLWLRSERIRVRPFGIKLIILFTILHSRIVRFESDDCRAGYERKKQIPTVAWAGKLIFSEKSKLLSFNPTTFLRPPFCFFFAESSMIFW